MKRLIPFLGAISTALLAMDVAGSPVELSRYRVILDRKPFGSETPPASAAGGAGASAAVEPFIKFIKISAFVRDDFSPIIRVGLVETRSNQSYLLAEGESADGILLVRAEFDRERVLISKDSLAYWLTMDGTYTLGAEEADQAAAEAPTSIPAETAATSAPPAKVESPVPAARVPSVSRAKVARVRSVPVEPPVVPEVASATGTPTGPTTPRRTLTERRRMIDEIRKRRAELNQSRILPAEDADAETVALLPTSPNTTPTTTARSDIPPPVEGSEMERQLQEYQMQAIREGREPLPIPLTPEIDEQLVREGLLPPAE